MGKVKAGEMEISIRTGLTIPSGQVTSKAIAGALNVDIQAIIVWCHTPTIKVGLPNLKPLVIELTFTFPFAISQAEGGNRRY